MKRLVAFLLALSCGLAAGCAGGPAIPNRFEWNDGHQRVLLLDRDLKGDIRVDDTMVDWTLDGRLLARVKIRNYSNSAVNLLVQTIFVDNDGQPVESTNEWQHVHISKNATHFHESNSFSSEASDFVVQIRRAEVH